MSDNPIRDAVTPSPPGIGTRLTGSTGEAPVLDGGMRGLIAAALTAVVSVALVDELGVLDADQVGRLAPLFTLIAFAAWGVYDKLRKRGLL